MQVMCMSIQLYSEPNNVIMLMTKLLPNITDNDKTYNPSLAVRLYTNQNDLEGSSLGNCKVENHLLMLSLQQNSCHRQTSRYIHTGRKQTNYIYPHCNRLQTQRQTQCGKETRRREKVDRLRE